jgi:hypothetical protein
MKVCSVCRKELPRERFYKKAKNKDGLTCACKDCRREHYQNAHVRCTERIIWQAMRQRCNNPNNDAYHNYGGRGIECCDRWESFDVFLSDMGKRPTLDHTLDRVDTNGNYCPENCRWATKKEQARNTRRTKLSEGAIEEIKRRKDSGESFRAMAKEYGCCPKTISNAYYGRAWA